MSDLTDDEAIVTAALLGLDPFCDKDHDWLWYHGDGLSENYVKSFDAFCEGQTGDIGRKSLIALARSWLAFKDKTDD